MRPLGDEVGHHAINADRGQRECGGGEEREQQHREAALRQRDGDDFVHRPHAEHRLVGIDGAHLASNRFREQRRVAGRPNDEGEVQV